MSDFPDAAPARAPWLVTLADLALLLLGFMLLVQATAGPARPALARGLRAAFGPETPPALPVAAHAVRFAPGSADARDADALVAWAVAGARDPRVVLTITAATDGTAADRDPATGSAALLAADRARAVAALILRPAPQARVRLLTDPTPRGRLATATLAFGGERP